MIKLSHWNYRVIRHKNRGVVYFGLHEVYYNEDGIDLWTESAVAAIGDSPYELRETLGKMLSALDKPVLTEKRGELVEYSTRCTKKKQSTSK